MRMTEMATSHAPRTTAFAHVSFSLLRRTEGSGSRSATTTNRARTALQGNIPHGFYPPGRRLRESVHKQWLSWGFADGQGDRTSVVRGAVQVARLALEG